MSKLLSIVSPVYNELGNIGPFVEQVSSEMAKTDVNFEIIFCVDPSTDGTEALIRELHKVNPRVKMLRFSRRFGQPSATLAGLHLATGDAVVVMDVDLQDPPSVLPEMIQEWRNGSPIVLAKRRSRTGEPVSKKWISSVGYSFLNKFAEVPIPADTGDFRLLDRHVVDELKGFPETNSFLRGLVAMVGFDTTTVEFDRPERYEGTTKYNRWFGSLKIGFNGVVGYSTALLSMTTYAGVIIAGIAIILALGYASAKLFGYEFPMGNPTIVISVLFLGGLNLLSAGVLGMYIGRIYEEVKGRPRFIVQESIGIEIKRDFRSKN